MPERATWSAYHEPMYDDTACCYCHAQFPGANEPTWAPGEDSWMYQGFCDAECAGYFLISKATWSDDNCYPRLGQRVDMLAAFGNLARFARKQTGLDRDLAFTQVSGDLPHTGNLPTTNTTNRSGLTAGFHYGTFAAPCNGVLHWTAETHTDGRQIAVCDTCNAHCVPRLAQSREDLERLKRDEATCCEIDAALETLRRE
jgi:hypothetical protein